MSANLNTGRMLDEIEAVLEAGRDTRRCREALAILQRWQWDRDLDAPSRTRAASLLRLFARRYRAKAA